jgi:hypothetical protein
MLRLTFVPVALVAAMALTGCDPQAPGASGTMTLGPGVDATAFQTLSLRTFANASGTFDPSTPIPADAYWDTESTAAITFPYRYSVGGPVGTSAVGDWQMFAWLSHRTMVDLIRATGPDPGDPSCSVAYRVGGCGAGLSGYCGITGGVDCVLVSSPVPSR